MLAVLADGDFRAVAATAAAGTLDAGAFAIGVARSWARAGRDVLVVDADAHGTGLSKRIGAATRARVPPAQRGLPSLIAARTPLDERGVLDHCWALPASGNGSVLLLGAPGHAVGARRSAEWLAEQADAVAALSAQRAVIVSMPGSRAEPYAALTDAAALRVTLSTAAGTAPPGGLRALLAAFWLRFGPDPLTLVCTSTGGAEGPQRTDAAGAAAGLAVVGRLGPVSEPALLGGRARQRDRAALEALDAASSRLHDLAALRAGMPHGAASGNGLMAAHYRAGCPLERSRSHVPASGAAGARR